MCHTQQDFNVHGVWLLVENARRSPAISSLYVNLPRGSREAATTSNGGDFQARLMSPLIGPIV
jgi:hypothetical protein